MSALEEISLIIKAPSSKHDDFKLKCQLSWTILELKITLCKEYPSKPNISDQRLIYSGHLLKDEQSLRDIIKSSDNNDVYTFHLVCPQRPSPGTTSTASSSANRSTPAAVADNAAGTSQSAAAGGSTQTTGPSNAVPLASSSPSGQAPVATPLGSGNLADMRESYNAMMAHYYQYMSYYYSQATQPTAAAGAIPDTTSSYYAFTEAYLRGMTGNLPGPGFIPNINLANLNGAVPGPAGPNVIQANAGGAAAAAAAGANVNPNNPNERNDAVDDEEANRDWTDMLYSFSKAMVMLSIMYFYSSFTRLLLILTIAMALYLFKNFRGGGLENILNAANNNNNINNNNNNPNIPDNNVVREQPQGQMAEPVNNNNNNEEAVNNRETEAPDDVANAANAPNAPAAAAGVVLPDNSRYSGLRLVWVFVTSLFTSLIPDPAPIN